MKGREKFRSTFFVGRKSVSRAFERVPGFSYPEKLADAVND